MKEILTASDLDLSHSILFKYIQVDHKLCSFAIIKCVENTTRDNQGFKCYRWKDSNNVITFIHNNYGSTSRLEVNFTSPLFEKSPITDIDQNGNKRTKLHQAYTFDRRTSISSCDMFVMTYDLSALKDGEDEVVKNCWFVIN